MNDGTQIGLVLGIVIGLVILTACGAITLAMFLLGWIII